MAEFVEILYFINFQIEDEAIDIMYLFKQLRQGNIEQFETKSVRILFSSLF